MTGLGYRWGWMSLFWAIAVGGTGAAIAATPISHTLPTPSANSLIVPSLKADFPAARDASTTVSFQTYTLPEVFAIQMPEGWFAVDNKAQRSALLTSYDPNRPTVTSPQLSDMLTEVAVIDENPSTFVDREINSLIAGDRVIDNYGYAAVDGQTAFRIWLLDSPLPEFTRQVITFVGYGDVATVKIVTHYNNPDPSIAEEIVEIHRSFQLLP